MINKVKKITAAVSLALLTQATPTLAQEQKNDSTEAQNAKEKQIEKITVMATKRLQTIQEVPISMMAFGAEEIEKSGMEELQDVGTYTPNLYVSKSSQQVSHTISMRGVGTSANSALEPSVATYIDGVYIARPGALLGNLSDIEMIEVLRGPQGTLFGRNASIGAMSIRTKRPELDEQMAKVSVGAGNYGAKDISLTANTNLTDVIAARVNLNYSKDDGYGENLYDDNKKLGEKDAKLARLGLLYQPNDEFNALLRLDYQKLTGTGLPVEVNPDTVAPERLAVLNYLGALPDTDGLDFTVNQIHNDTMASKQWGATLELNWDNVFSGYSIKSTSSYRDWDNQTLEDSVLRLPIDILSRGTDYTSQAISQEIQLVSPIDESYDYVAGLYYYQEDYTIDQTAHLGTMFCPIAVRAALSGAPQALVNQYVAICSNAPQRNVTPTDFNQDTESYAAYYQGTWHINSKFDITTGIRYTKDEKSGTMLVTPTNPIAESFIAAAEDHQLSFNDSQLTWLLNAKYQVSNDLMLFATASTGYKSGAFNSVMTPGGLTTDQRIIESEDVKNYELGVKSTSFDGMLTTNATLYRTDIENFQDRSFKDLVFITSNVGELRQQGLELEANLYPTDELTLRASYAYLDSEFLDYKNATNLPGLSGTQDLTGAPNKRSPKHQFSMIAEYRDALPNTNMQWYTRAESNWMDDMNIGATTNDNPQDIQQAYALTNIRFGLSDQDESWDVQLYVENVSDKAYCIQQYNQPFGSQFGTVSNGGTLGRCVMGTPRTFGIRSQFTF